MKTKVCIRILVALFSISLLGCTKTDNKVDKVVNDLQILRNLSEDITDEIDDSRIDKLPRGLKDSDLSIVGKNEDKYGLLDINVKGD